MGEPLRIFQTASAMAQHAGKRQALTAQNVANSDTPGYVAKSMPSFADTYGSHANFEMRTTRTNHISNATHRQMSREGGSEPSPNGNAVSVEEEMFRAVEISREHNRALTIYRHALTVIRTTLGRS